VGQHLTGRQEPRAGAAHPNPYPKPNPNPSPSPNPNPNPNPNPSPSPNPNPNPNPNLVQALLTIDPKQRATAEDVLKMHWITGNAPTNDLSGTKQASHLLLTAYCSQLVTDHLRLTAHCLPLYGPLLASHHLPLAARYRRSRSTTPPAR
jgi:serine/threonine protein kinase